MGSPATSSGVIEKEAVPKENNSDENPSLEDRHFITDQSGPETESLTVLKSHELVEKYDGSRLTGVRKPSYERLSDQKVCATDLDASPMQSSDGGSSVMAYRDHYIVDGGKQRIILHVLVTPASIMDNIPSIDLIRRV